MDTRRRWYRQHPTRTRRITRSGPALLLAGIAAAALLPAPAGAAAHSTTTRGASKRGVTAHGHVPMHPARVEASIDHAGADYGSPLVITGTVEDPENPGTQPKDRVVELVHRNRSGTRVRTLARHQLAPNGHGGFIFDITADRTGFYLVKYLGNTNLSAADSQPLQFGVFSTVTATADHTQLHPGEAFTVSATILPAVPDEGAWVVQMPPNQSLAQGRTDRNGHVTFHITAPDKPGTYNYAVACENYGPDDQTEGASQYLHITVSADGQI